MDRVALSCGTIVSATPKVTMTFLRGQRLGFHNEAFEMSLCMR